MKSKSEFKKQSKELIAYIRGRNEGYEQGKSDGRTEAENDFLTKSKNTPYILYTKKQIEERDRQKYKQTLSEVLKWINDNWTEHRSFGFSIKEMLEQKLREMKK